jgi:ribosomal protein L36
LVAGGNCLAKVFCGCNRLIKRKLRLWVVAKLNYGQRSKAKTCCEPSEL